MAAAALASDREPSSVTLIGVSKTRPAVDVIAAAEAGLTDFGENYVLDAVPKIAACGDAGSQRTLTWHYIGAIQSNKTRLIAQNFSWVHTVTREKIARRLSEQVPEGRVLNVCLQVNVDEDPNKGGVSVAAAGPLLQQVVGLPGLNVRGLMTILDQRSRPFERYAELAALFERMAGQAGPDWDTLSMGMSNDYGAAIRAGATHVRIGTAIFGERLY